MSIFEPFDPRYPRKIPLPPLPAVTGKHYLDTDEERAKLTDLTIGVGTDLAAHESAGIMRMHRAGYSGPEIQKTLGVFPQQIMHEMKLAMDDETEADELGRPIHDAEPAKADTKYRRARDVVKGDELVEYGRSVESIRILYNDVIFVLEGGAEVKIRPLDEILIRPAK